MQSSQEILKNKKPYGHMSYEVTKLPPYDHMSYDKDEFDEIVDQFPNLYDKTNRKLRVWQARRIGVDLYYQQAKKATTEGKNPKKYFTYLLKNIEN